jgi:hypothetical protein
MTAKQVRPILRKWQRLLCLNQWKIRVQFGDLKSESNEQLDGCICWSGEYRDAFISIHKDALPADLESTVIHELCHLLLEGHLSAPRDYNSSYEFGLNTLSDLMAKLEKQSSKDKYQITCPCGKKVTSAELGHFQCKECGRTALLQWNTPEASKPRPNQYLRGPA